MPSENTFFAGKTAIHESLSRARLLPSTEKVEIDLQNEKGRAHKAFNDKLADRPGLYSVQD